MAETVTLEELAKDIRDLWHQADTQDDENRIKLGRMLLDAQNRIHAAGKITWERWVKRNIKRSDRDVRRLIALVKDKTDAEARKALAEERAKAAAAMRQSRGKKSESAEDRTNVSPVSPAAQPARSMPEAVAQDSLEAFKAEVKEHLDELSEPDVRKFCEWVREYEAERFSDDSTGSELTEAQAGDKVLLTAS